jgi:hypothetical protein
MALTVTELCTLSEIEIYNSNRLASILIALCSVNIVQYVFRGSSVVMVDASITTELMCEFIELYRNLPALWQVKSKEHSDRKREHYDVVVAKYQGVEPNADGEILRKKNNSLHTNSN